MSSNTEASTESVSESLAEKKYEVLKRKCDSLEETNETLRQKLTKIRKMISEAEKDKKFLEKRLQGYESETLSTINTETTKAVPSQTHSGTKNALPVPHQTT
ncbi:PREDICTED: uncharacterized protein LOC105312212 [Amphimedon queenslandica]|uniref:INO80 complex subunit F domain-containing protein n=1 Tax=Amphimedon queenslandica TaxID=400682 RepID=A0A1X7V928_AMPQE|nr:PREDICTED: uncharacterized protein LOC105312212 [Amphimedon queenslandica]|eukprot:XP_011402982.1 PREDICTED: uncharacterized protein LOC105312212 [Amphimedon queenslandica]